MSSERHIPVLLAETLQYLQPKPGERYIDCTLGLGGHAAAVAEKIGKSGSIIGIDADEDNLKVATQQLQQFSCNKTFIHSNFVELPQFELAPADMILADLGMSSVHIDEPERGFTYRQDVPLDLRYDRSNGWTASELLAGISEKQLADILYQFGEIRQSYKLAAALQQDHPTTTGALISTVENALGQRGRDMLPQIFQALRIAVNRELEALEVLLQHGPSLLRPGGRMVIISFHSLEDRMVKHAFRQRATGEIDETTGQEVRSPEYALLTKKPVCATELEQETNPRARSAKLRALQKQVY